VLAQRVEKQPTLQIDRPASATEHGPNGRAQCRSWADGQVMSAPDGCTAASGAFTYLEAYSAAQRPVRAVAQALFHRRPSGQGHAD
jgi:hypothetical protein